MSQTTLSVYTDLRELYRPQRVWAEGRGVLLVAAHFLSGAGGGAWLLGVVLGFPLALLMGLIAVALSGLVHLGFLGRPERAWKMVLKVRSSWISRGLWSIIIFLPTGALYAAGAYGAWSTRSAFGIVMLVLSLIGMAGIFLYKGFVYAVSRAVPLWHSPVLPVQYIAVGLRGGAALALAGLPFTDAALGHNVQTWWLATSVAAVFLFLVELYTGHDDPTFAQSLRLLWQGGTRWILLVGVVIVGLILPAVLVILSYPLSLATAGLVVAGVASLVGDLCYKYCMNAAGIYVPLLQKGGPPL